jgi:hypothetical protein
LENPKTRGSSGVMRREMAGVERAQLQELGWHTWNSRCLDRNTQRKISLGGREQSLASVLLGPS